MLTAEQRAKELAQFFGMAETDALAKLNLGFGYHHAEVTADWKRANPQTDEEILEWYRKTDKYCWELSAYHLDPGFNYMGMCAGISEALRAKGVDSVLCLGDGIGDLTLKLKQDGLWSSYHDLYGSQTAKFADMRLADYLPSHAMRLSHDWTPDAIGTIAKFDAIVSLDFLEHLTRPDIWMRAIFAGLKPGGWALLQNAFAIGSGPNGSIPCHLERNDKYETEYGPLMLEIGFVQEGTSNWWRKPA